jgi:hypothetical protein
MSFTRRYSFDPGTAELLKIEGVVIIDRDPPAALAGGATGMVTVVGEFEDGSFNEPTEIVSNTDFVQNFGSFGYTYDGVPSNNPCARGRKSDGALNFEYWNGNGFITCVNKKFRRLAVVRVDTSVGEVQFTRRASVLGNSKYQWDLEPGQQLTLDIGGGPLNAIFNAAVGILTSGAQTYPTGFSGGEQMVIVVDENTPNQIGPVTVTFLAGDTTQAAIISRINLAFGFTLAAASSATVTTLSGRVRGTSGNVRVVSQTAAVGTALAFSTTAATGTGNVANIDQVTFAEVQTIVQAAVAGSSVERTPAGLLRVAANSAATITPTAATTALDFGFTLGVAGAAATGNAGSIPAGTRVRTAGGTEWVTMKTVAVTAASLGPYSVRVRPANDDGTTASALAGAVVVVPFADELASFSVINPQPIAAALTEAAIDAAYVTALSKTLSPNYVTRDTELLLCSRSSNAVRQAGRTNVIEASAVLKGRKFVMRPPLNTRRIDARSTSAQPGSGAYRSDRVIYSYPGTCMFVPQIASRGLAGGAGFTADGIIDCGFDAFEASCMSQLNPEENPGQLTSFMSQALGVERGNSDVQSMDQGDYVAFRAAGIAALIMEDGNATIQSGVVNVDPALYANIKNIARRRMADFVQDSLAVALKPFVKKLATKQRRGECVGVVEAFLHSLLSPGNPSAQRIEEYKIDAKSGNTPEALALGIFRIIVKVKTLASLDVIVLETTIGETVTFNDVSEAA